MISAFVKNKLGILNHKLCGWCARLILTGAESNFFSHYCLVITRYLIIQSGVHTTTTTILIRGNQRKRVSSACHGAACAVPWHTQQLARLLWQYLGVM